MITSVKAGYCPSIPNNASHLLTLLIKSCWHHDCSLLPSAERVIELEEAMNNISTNEKLTHTSMVTVDDTSAAASSTILLASANISSDGDHSCDSQTCSTTNVAKVTEEQSGNDQSDAQGSCSNIVENSSNDILSTDYTSESVTEDHNNVTCLEAAKSTLKVR